LNRVLRCFLGPSLADEGSCGLWAKRGHAPVCPPPAWQRAALNPCPDLFPGVNFARHSLLFACGYGNLFVQAATALCYNLYVSLPMPFPNQKHTVFAAGLPPCFALKPRRAHGVLLRARRQIISQISRSVLIREQCKFDRAGTWLF
jgi:hypothetical protein